jgi:hypothetical protein
MGTMLGIAIADDFSGLFYDAKISDIRSMAEGQIRASDNDCIQNRATAVQNACR